MITTHLAQDSCLEAGMKNLGYGQMRIMQNCIKKLLHYNF